MAFRTIKAIPMPAPPTKQTSNKNIFTEIGANRVIAKALLVGNKMSIPPIISSALMTAIYPVGTNKSKNAF